MSEVNILSNEYRLPGVIVRRPMQCGPAEMGLLLGLTTWAEMATDDHGEMRCDVSDGCDVSDVSTVAENGQLSIEMDAICYPSMLICYPIC